MQNPTKPLLPAVISALILLSVFSTGTAQVNTETLRSGIEEEGFSATTNFSFGLSEGNVRFFNLLGNARIDYHKQNNRSFAVVQYSRGVQNGELFRNAGFLALRNTYYLRPPVGWEVFLQQQFDEFIRLRDRKVAGTGIRLKLINHENEELDRKLHFFLGIGGMYEYEDINAVIPEQTSLIRSTNYISLHWIASKRVSLSAVTYFQVALTDFSDYRNLLEGSLEVKLTETVAMTVGINHRYDSRPPAEVKPYDIQIRNGLSVLF